MLRIEREREREREREGGRERERESTWGGRTVESKWETETPNGTVLGRARGK
jgi:hypothetical protein